MEYNKNIKYEREMILVEINYRELLVKIMKEVIENNFTEVIVHPDGNITGNCTYGFITEDSIYIPIPGEEERYRKKHNIPKEIPYKKLELGYINDIIISFNKLMFDEDEMNKICDDIYEILGDKFDLMTIEINPL
jgi:hypothetical protein